MQLWMTITSGTTIFLDFGISQNKASTTCKRERVVGRGFFLCVPGEGGTGQVVLAWSDVNKTDHYSNSGSDIYFLVKYEARSQLGLSCLHHIILIRSC